MCEGGGGGGRCSVSCCDSYFPSLLPARKRVSRCVVRSIGLQHVSTMKEDVKSCTYSIPCQEVVRCVEFSPFQWSCQLLAFATASRVTVVSCCFQVGFIRVR